MTEEQQWEIGEVRKRIAGSVAAVNDYLGKLLTLCTALTGGGFLLAKGEVMPRGFAAAAVFVLILAILATVGGLMPSDDKPPPQVNVFTLGEFARLRAANLQRKSKCAWVASGLFILALLVAVAGLAFSG